MNHRKLDVLTPIPAPSPTVCRKLRTKVAFGSPAPALADWRHGTSTTAVYWCLSTMESAGPDEALVHAQDCRAGRACFIAPEGSNPELLA
jgi:hypothetical protein